MITPPLTPTDILAAASEVLLAGHYRRIPEDVGNDWGTRDARLFEDRYGIVAVVVYPTWNDAEVSWIDAQAALVDVISRFITAADPKAWDGYLVLFTPAILSREARVEADRIRHDTTHVRKLIATGEEVKTVADVRRALLPLLPFQEVDVAREESILTGLPVLLEEKGIPREAIDVVMGAFLEQEPLVEKLHSRRRRT
jgi:hypothetical protein